MGSTNDVWREPGPAVGFRIVNFEHQGFVAPHLWKSKTNGDLGCTSNDKSAPPDAGNGARPPKNRQWLYSCRRQLQADLMDRLIDRPPHLNNRETAGQ